MNRAVGCWLLLGLVAACGGSESDEIVVTDAWTRPSPATVDSAAVYVSLSNGSGTDDELVGASSDRCGLVQPHLTTIDADGIASMAEAIGDRLELPDGERLEMAPNGLHLMCIGLTEPFVAGEEFDIQLDFATRAPLQTTATVEQR